MNAYIRIRMLLLLILAGVILCQPLLADYTDPHQRFSLDPPKDWQVQTSADGSGMTLFVAPDGKTSLMVFPAEVPENATLDELPSAYEQVLKKTQPGISLKLLKETRVEIAGESALQREYHAETGDGNPIKMMATFIKVGPMSLTLVAIANETEFSKFEPTFRQCIESLRFSAAKGAEVLSDVQSKLKALEAAHESGILTDEEYGRKKAELEAQSRGTGHSTHTYWNEYWFNGALYSRQ